MTQGAIDLAQGELTRADPDADRRRERLDFARGTTREPPQLLSKTTVRIDDEHANRHRSPRPVERRYAWRDAPDSIVVTVRDADLPDGAGVAAAVATFEPTRFALDVPLPDGSKATLTILSGKLNRRDVSTRLDANRGEIRARLVKSSSSAGARGARFAQNRRRRRFSPTRRTTLARRRRLPTSPRFEGDSSNSARTPRRRSSLALIGSKPKAALAPTRAQTRYPVDARRRRRRRRRGEPRVRGDHSKPTRGARARSSSRTTPKPRTWSLPRALTRAPARGRASACSPTLAKIALSAPSRSARSAAETCLRARSRAVDARRVSSDTTTRGWISSWRCV